MSGAGDGHEVDHAVNGAEGIGRIEAASFDLVLVDLIMPVQEGMETILQIRQRYPKLPVIAMSGGGQRNFGIYLDMAAKLGARRTLHKPFAADELLDAVRDALAE